MNILVPTIGLGPAGGNRVLSKLATEWIKLGHNVVFLAFEVGGPVYFPTEADVIWFNIEGEIVSKPDSCAGHLSVYKFTKLMRKMIKSLHESYDVVLLNHSITVWPAILAGVRKKCFYYVQLHEPEVFLAAAKTLVQKLNAISLWATYYLIPKERCFVNSAMYVGYKGIGTSAPIIPPGIDLELYSKKEFHQFHEKITFGIIGRKEPWKGVSQAIDAIRVMLEKGMDVRLKVAYGNMTEGIIDGIERYVEVVVPENDKELADFYRSVDIMLALATIQLGAPHYPVIESMACGTPVITTGYFPADEESAYIVPVNTPESVANVVEEMMGGEESVRKKINLAREKVLCLSWDYVASVMITHIEAVKEN